jgi:aerobic carbon-monoxide dehydrogenase large subunit
MTGLVGARVARTNDPRLLTGTGRFVDDLRLPGLVHAAVVRSPIAHGRVRSCATGAARESDGVLDVIAVGDDGLAPMPCVWIAPGQRQTSVPILDDVVRYVGQPVALVVATSRAAAEDAAELVDVDYDELPAVTDAQAAMADGAPLLNPSWGTNIAADYTVGDTDTADQAADHVTGRASDQAADHVTRAADHVAEMTFRIGRVTGSPIETRGIVARHEPGGLTVWISTQVPHHARDHLAECLGLGFEKVRVIAPEVGGGFGTKEHVYPDEVLVCLAAIRTGRPVKWIEDRAEHFTATLHARDSVHRARLAYDADGTFRAIHSDIVGNLGAYPSNVGTGPFRISAVMLPGPYRFDRAGARIRGVVTNTTPTGAYRGFGMMEACWVRERLVDEVARRLGRDPVELRRHNMIRPDELPHETRTHQKYDSGDYPAALEMVRRRVESRPAPPDDGRRRGVGYASHVEFTGLGPSRDQRIVGFHLGGFETAIVRMGPDGTVTVASGVCGMGQGIETSLAQLAADRLGVAMDDVRVVLGDTAATPYSATGSIASRSITVGGGAVVTSAERLRAKIIAVAAHQLEASPDDLEIVDGAVRVKGDPNAGRTLRDVARLAWLGWDLPDGFSPGLEEKEVYDPPQVAYSYATHAAAVAVDTETGAVEIEGYWVAHDCGTVVNPMIVDGQIHGAVAQGIGNALLEQVVYSGDGQPLTTTYLDYLLPLSADVPDMTLDHLETPSPFTPGGMKGMGEGGVIASPAAIGNAVAAALPEICDRLTATPLSPPVLWTLLNA